MIHYNRLKLVKKLKICKLFIVLTLLCMGVGLQPKHISANQTTVVKVGYPTVVGFTEVKDGVYSGYAYEYLTEIAKYTGWEYEFIEMSMNDLNYQLMNGEIDLAAGMLKNDQTVELYDFPEDNAGYTYTTLTTLKENTSISSSNLETLQGIKVGYFETSAVRKVYFDKFCEVNEIEDIELIPYQYDADRGQEILLEALRAKEVDAIISGDLLLGNSEKVIVKFGPTPYYFATTKGNKEVLAGLNKAINKIKENNANFDQQLYNKYFQDYMDDIVHLTQEEQEFVEHMTPLKAVYVDNYAPMQDYNPKTNKVEGIYIDIMELIAGKSGIQYELVRASTHEEAFLMMQNKEVDLFICAPDDYMRASQYGYTQTQEFMEVNMVKVMNSNKKSNGTKEIIAIPCGYLFTEFEGEYEIKYYNTIEECIAAVNDGEADSTYGNSYTISRYISSGYYPNISIVFNESSVKAGIGIVKPTNLILLNIINKAIGTISENELNTIIYSNTYNVRNHVTLEAFFYDNSVFCISIILIIAVLIWLIVYMRYCRLKKDKLILLKKSQLDVLTDVYNRTTGTELVKNYLQTTKDHMSWAFIIIDIDHFKQVNDSLGHQKGDDLLIEFSQTLKHVFSYEDIIFRLGGDEFIVFMKDLEEESQGLVEKKLNKISKIMDKELRYKGKYQRISLSIGAVLTQKVCNFDKLYLEADQMLYMVKQNGRNGYKLKTLNET